MKGFLPLRFFFQKLQIAKEIWISVQTVLFLTFAVSFALETGRTRLKYGNSQPPRHIHQTCTLTWFPNPSFLSGKIEITIFTFQDYT
jgi:hypothetical protein